MKIKLGEHIRAERRARGMTQEALAEALDVTVGAVYKWESGQSAPELRLLVEMAELFAVSVDALLGYGWTSGSMATAKEEILACIRDKRFDEGIRLAERALTRYPNSFDMVYAAAEVNYLSMKPAHALRAVELYRDAIRLLSQCTEARINRSMLENRIASALCFVGKYDEAIEIWERNNTEGQNDYHIGLILSQQAGREDEALPYLSNALGHCISTLNATVIGLVGVYMAQGKTDEAREIVEWGMDVFSGLRERGAVTYFDRLDIRGCTILAAIAQRQGDPAEAKAQLRRAKAIAERFDAAPDYTMAHVRFYHGPESARVQDDMGERAIDVILGFLADAVGADLRPIWKEIEDEA